MVWHSLKIGLSFGLTSGVITTLGLMVGVHAGTHSRLAVIGAIITIAVADALSDALGIHISEESENIHTHNEIWIATGATFISKFAFALTFIVPVLLYSLNTAIVVSIIWGLVVLVVVSYFLAKQQKTSPWRTIGEHLFIAILVIVITHNVGHWVADVFG